MAPETVGTKGSDPLYDIPLLGRIIQGADDLRARSRLGRVSTRTEADVLRMQARALRLVANVLESRAGQLERASRKNAGGERPRIERIRVD
ncbi:MAG: hypothetical protein KY455_12870 [Euryarchaeota archaeon]|nr:hypothetical protein [Euryarchaeota archaeon]